MYACALNLYSLKSGSLLIRGQFILMFLGFFFFRLSNAILYVFIQMFYIKGNGLGIQKSK